MNTKTHFQKKTYGRIWVAKTEDIAKVRDIIKKQDAFEFEYLPNNFIAVYDGYLFSLTYGHKFELEYLELTQRCLTEGIWIVCITGGTETL